MGIFNKYVYCNFFCNMHLIERIIYKKSLLNTYLNVRRVPTYNWSTSDTI